jgi:prophage regulatory protein
MSLGFYDKKTVTNLTTLSTTTLWRRVREGTFPAPIVISKGRVAWDRGAVDKWIRDKVAAAGRAT